MKNEMRVFFLILGLVVVLIGAFGLLSSPLHAEWHNGGAGHLGYYTPDTANQAYNQRTAELWNRERQNQERASQLGSGFNAQRFINESVQRPMIGLPQPSGLRGLPGLDD
jgi:hypothetical protein